MINFETIVGYTSGVIGRVSELHAKYYAEYWNFGHFFEAKVATELSRFINTYNASKDRIWSLAIDGTIEGSITIDGTSERKNMAHLRWFIMSDALRGKGFGNRLINAGIDFCKNKGYQRVYLWTFEGLDVAKHLYEKSGFKLVERQKGIQWGTEVIEQRYELQFDN